jgi:hypothetical protein
MFISGDKDKQADKHDPKHDAKHADAKVAKPYEGDDRRVSGLADRRAIPAAKWPIEKFPGWYYHATDGKKIVNSQAEADDLGAGWQDTPIAPAKPAAPAPAPDHAPAAKPKP